MSTMNTVRQIEACINECARDQRTTNYGEVVKAFGLDELRPDWANHPLSGIFHILDLEDIVKDRPLRTALVITADDNRPSGGFFKISQEYKRYCGRLGDENAEAVYWTAELRRVFAYWKKS